MPTTKKIFKITPKEEDILEVLWDSDTPLLASDIPKINPSLSISTVQLALRNLLSKNIIEVANIVYSGTVLTRSYIPIISAEQYAADQLQAIRINTLNFSTMNFINHLTKNDETDILSELEDTIRHKKEEIE